MDKNKVMQLAKNAKSFDEFKAGLEAGGVKLTGEQLVALEAKFPTKKSGKLDDDDLDNVSGGAWYHSVGEFFAGIGGVTTRWP